MAISPPSDIVLGVARAVDPSSFEAAAQRLARMGAVAAPASVPASESAAAPSAADWKALVMKLEATAGQSQPPVSPLQLASTHTGTVTTAKSSPFKQFESFVLQSFVESMLPQDAESVFGGGIAGQYWKSMMAEKLAEQLAETGSVGIARQIAAHSAGVAASASHPDGASKAPGVPPAPISPFVTETTTNKES